MAFGDLHLLHCGMLHNACNHRRHYPGTSDEHSTCTLEKGVERWEKGRRERGKREEGQMRREREREENRGRGEIRRKGRMQEHVPVAQYKKRKKNNILFHQS